MIREVVLVRPRGFCAGVVRAVETVEAALASYGPPVYVRRAIVHNPHVVQRLAERGAVFVQELDEVPAGAPVVLSAHGVARAVATAAAARDLQVIDATCPLVAKVHVEVQRFVADGYDVVLVGHAGHDEVIGTVGQAPGRVSLVETPEDVARLAVRDPERVACVTQTTLSPADVDPVVDALRARFPRLAQPRVEDICFATRNRQTAVRWLAEQADVVLVLGDRTSSNSVRLREVAEAAGTPAYLVGSLEDLDLKCLDGAETVGITAGASTPEDLVQSAVRYFADRGATVREDALLEEPVFFPLPAAVRAARSVSAGVA